MTHSLLILAAWLVALYAVIYAGHKVDQHYARQMSHALTHPRTGAQR